MFEGLSPIALLVGIAQSVLCLVFLACYHAEQASRAARSSEAAYAAASASEGTGEEATQAC